MSFSFTPIMKRKTAPSVFLGAVWLDGDQDEHIFKHFYR